MKEIFCMCLAALILFTGCSKSLSKNSKSVFKEKTDSPQQKEPHHLMQNSISEFSSDLCFTIEDGFRDVATIAGGALYLVGYIFTSDPGLEYTNRHYYSPNYPCSYRTNGNAPYLCR